MNHTQTPWIVKSIDEGESIRALEQSGNAFGIHDPEGIYFAFCLDDMGREEANAAYIVQAVNSHEAMLEALEDLIRHNEALNEAFYGQGTAKAMRAAMSGQKDLLMKARAAIAKGKGGQP